MVLFAKEIWAEFISELKNDWWSISFILANAFAPIPFPPVILIVGISS